MLLSVLICSIDRRNEKVWERESEWVWEEERERMNSFWTMSLRLIHSAVTYDENEDEKNYPSVRTSSIVNWSYAFLTSAICFFHMYPIQYTHTHTYTLVLGCLSRSIDFTPLSCTYLYHSLVAQIFIGENLLSSIIWHFYYYFFFNFPQVDGTRLFLFSGKSVFFGLPFFGKLI